MWLATFLRETNTTNLNSTIHNCCYQMLEIQKVFTCAMVSRACTCSCSCFNVSPAALSCEQSVVGPLLPREVVNISSNFFYCMLENTAALGSCCPYLW